MPSFTQINNSLLSDKMYITCVCWIVNNTEDI